MLFEGNWIIIIERYINLNKNYKHEHVTKTNHYTNKLGSRQTSDMPP